MTDAMVHVRAVELIGIPFVVGGRDFRQARGGTDCLGVGLEFRRLIGRPLDDPWQRVCDSWTGIAREFLWSDFELIEKPTVGACATSGEHLFWWAGGGWVLHATRNGGTKLSPIRRLASVEGWFDNA